MEPIIFITLRPKRPSAVTKIYIEINKIAAIEELTERAEVAGSRICVTGGHLFEVREKPEEVIDEITRLSNRAIDLAMMR